jgi:quercetin dioxygenase-like cupin family protein
MRPADSTDHPPAITPWPEAALVELTARLATQPVLAGATQPANEPHAVSASALQPADEPHAVSASALQPADEPHAVLASALQPADEPHPRDTGPLTGRVTGLAEGVLRLSTDPADHRWAVPLLVAAEVEAWLVGWPAGLATAVHDHSGGAEAVTVVEGALSEECLDPTIWTTGRRTTWRAGASTLFMAGHVHLLGAAGGRPAVAVHAWSGAAGSAGSGAGRSALPVCGGAAFDRGPGRGRGAVEVGPGGGRGRPWRADQPLHGALDFGHIRDRIAR